MTIKSLYKSPSFILGKCKCRCGNDIGVKKTTKNNLKLYAVGHMSNRKNPPIHRGKDNPNWNGGKSKHSEGYIELLQPEHPFANNKGYVLEHRLVWEQHNNAMLLQWAAVHHKNKIKTDNRIENLEAMMKSNHMSIHMTKDLSGRICSNCGSSECGLNSRGRPNWQHNYKGELICKKCYRREYWLKNRK